MPGTSPFETRLVKLLNTHFQTHSKFAFAYRLKQSHFYTQFLDIVVDSLDRSLYLGIECKSIGPQVKRIYFTQHFHTDTQGRHQVERIGEFLKWTQRFGVLAVERRRGVQGRGNYNMVMFIPFRQVEQWYKEGRTYIEPDELIRAGYPRLIRENGTTNLDYCISQLRQY